jgi:hypothetical protein
MMEAQNHETTGRAIGASKPDTVYDALVTGDPSRVSPTGTGTRATAPSAPHGPASGGRRPRKHRFGVCHRCGWSGSVSRVRREDHRQIGTGRAFRRLCDDCFDAVLGAPSAEGAGATAPDHAEADAAPAPDHAEADAAPAPDRSITRELAGAGFSGRPPR